jgi:hypothetical protein
MTAKVVPLEQVLPGAVLGDNVEDDRGRVLLRVGAILTESAIQTLRQRGIGSLMIDVAAEHRPEHQAVVRLHLESRLQLAFRHAGDSEARRQLWQALLEYKLGGE